MPEGGGDEGLDSDFPGTVWISMSLGVGFCAEDVLWGPAISGNKHAPWALDKVLPSLPPPATIPPPLTPPLCAPHWGGRLGKFRSRVQASPTYASQRGAAGVCWYRCDRVSHA